MKSLFIRFLGEEIGADMVEYALLTSVIGLTSIAGLDLIKDAIGSTYVSWESGVNALWEPPDPGAASIITSQ